MQRTTLRLITLFSCGIPFAAFPQTPEHNETRVEVTSDGWSLVGDLMLPKGKEPHPAVMMFNKAAGDRHVYIELASHLADRGIASLRIDLRGHGESTNLGSFIPGKNRPDPLIWDSEVDVIAVSNFLKSYSNIDSTRVGAIGGSYSGEEMAEAGRLSGYLDAYVELSPGSFSDESIDGIDSSNVPWLFIVSNNERYLKEITSSVQERSKDVELIIVPGTQHATEILVESKSMAERIAVWLAYQLQ